MAVNPNFTNANAFTPYASGGDSNFPSGISLPPIGNIRQDSFFSPSANCIAVDNTVGSTIRFVANPITAGDYQLGYVEVRPNQILAYQPLTGNASPFMNINQTALGTANPQFSLTGLSTLTAATFTANAVNLFSSLRGTFPTSFQ